MSKQTAKIFLYILLAALFIGIGWHANQFYEHNINLGEKRVKVGGFKFISPLLDVELPEGYNVRHDPIPFKYKVNKLVEQQTQSGKVISMSVYYRDLSDGPWFGINEKMKYNPASMMKVPVMIGWLKRAEKDSATLQRKIAFDEKSYNGPPQTIIPEQALKSGVSYTVEELLLRMMQFSDNRAMLLLYDNLFNEELANIVENMDVANDPTSGQNSISVHGYSGFLRILYNASFLNKEMSEKALELMSSPSFTHGIVAGIPKETRIASKFGEFEGNGVIQLHEYAIVYHPKGPYILGVLTRGGNWKTQADVIKSVSELVYKSVAQEQ